MVTVGQMRLFFNNISNLSTFSVVLFCIVLFIFYSTSGGKWGTFSDRAYFGGDTWEYQSMAVNWAKGHGLKFGSIEKFSVYKFDQGKEKEYYSTFIRSGKNGGFYNYYRTPGYPIFVGVIYKIFGITLTEINLC